MTIRNNLSKEEILKLVGCFKSSEPAVFICMDEDDAAGFIEKNIVVELSSKNEINSTVLIENYGAAEKLVLISGDSTLQIGEVDKISKIIPTEKSLVALRGADAFSVILIFKSL